MKMQNKYWQHAVLAGAMGLLMAALAVRAADPSGSKNERGKNWFSVSPRYLFNVSAEFQHLATPANPGSGVGVPGSDHVYDNGYVLRDDSYDPETGRNAGDKTWNWGFWDNPGQPPSIQGNSLVLQTLRSPADGRTQTVSDDPQCGFEVNYGRVLKEFEISADKLLRVGLQGAFGMTFLDIKNKSTISGLTTGVRDTYDLSGLPLIPNAPFNGSAPVVGGPEPLLLPDSPVSRQSIEAQANAMERMKLDGQLYGFKVGPFVEWPLGDSVSLQFQGGFAAMLVDGKFTWNEQIDATTPTSDSASKNQWCYGGFAEAQLNFNLSDHWGVFAGAGWQHVGDYSLQAGSKAVELKLDNVISAFCGLTYSF